MMLGDTGAPELGLIVVRHARSRPGADPGRLGSHEAMFIIDLGLGRADDTGTVRAHWPDVQSLLDRLLPALGGTLERAARYALRLAAVRTGVVSGSEPVP